MQQDRAVFVGLDTSKMKISVALAEEGRQGEVRFLGEIDSTPEAVRRLVTKLAGQYRRLLFCYEAGPTGYGSRSGSSRPSCRLWREAVGIRRQHTAIHDPNDG